MKPRLTHVALCLALAVVYGAGCDRSQDPPVPVSPTGGGISALPRTSSVGEQGILKDLAGYTPASIPKLGSSAGDVGAGGDNADAAAVDQIKEMLVGVVASAIKGDFAVVLENFEKESVKALAENSEAMSLLTDTYERIDSILRVIGEKTGTPVDLAKAAEEAGAQLRQLDMVKVDVVDAENATVRLELSEEMMQQAAAAMAAQGVPAEAMTADSIPPLPVRRVNGRWVIVPPMALQQAEVAQLVTALKALKPVGEKFQEAIEKAEFKTPEELQAVVMPLAMPMLNEFMTQMAQLEGEAGGADAENANEPSDAGANESGEADKANENGSENENGNGG